MTYYKQQQKSLQKGLVALHTLGKSLGNQQETTWLLEMEAEKKQKQSKKKKERKERKFISFVTVATTKLTQLLRLLHNKNIWV